MAAASNTEVDGRGATSPTTAAGVMAVESPMVPVEASGTARGDRVASPTTAAAIRAGARGVIATSRTAVVAMEAAVRAEATASPATGGSGVLAGRARPGAVRVLARPLGPTALGKKTRTGTVMSDRAAAQQGLLAL